MIARFLVAGLVFALPAMARDYKPCDTNPNADKPCVCDANTLRPLQGAIGLHEVMKKKSDIEKDMKHEWKDLEDDPIKVVRGPGNALFITDHHHGADAWRLAGKPDILCQIDKRPDFTTDEQFWSALKKDKLVRLADAEGKQINETQLPVSLANMPDDPYRSLAWMLRKEDGFCRSKEHLEFQEFSWADWLRNRNEISIAAIADSPKDQVEIAKKLARSKDAALLVGYIGDQPKGYDCKSGK